MGKVFFFTVAAVFVGIWVFASFSKPKGKNGKPAPSVYKDGAGATLFAGPDIDPVSGGYLQPGAKVGTVEFPAQDN